MIELRKICKRYSNSSPWVLKDLSFKLEKGKCLALLGASGSGKSTCLKLINRLIEADSGDILVAEQNIKDYDLIELRQKVSYFFQKGLLFPHMTVRENICIALNSDKAKEELRARELLELMDLNPQIFLDRYPHELSGGQAQRVSLAQAMAINPEILLMDEPFNGLDSKTKYALMEKILEIKNEFHKTIVLVSHDAYEAEFLSDEILELVANNEQPSLSLRN